MLIAPTCDITHVSFLQHRIPSLWPDATPQGVQFQGGNIFMAFKCPLSCQAVLSSLFHLLFCESLLQDAPTIQKHKLYCCSWLQRLQLAVRCACLLRTHTSHEQCTRFYRKRLARQTYFVISWRTFFDRCCDPGSERSPSNALHL